jgi:putative tricarboxylic transport membrane protein
MAAYCRRCIVTSSSSIVCFIALCAAFPGAAAHGETLWRPSKPIEIISPSAPGGSTDTTARVIQTIMQQHRLANVPLAVVNKAGGNQTVAIAYLNQHMGDGHYFAIASPALNANYLTGVSDLRYLDVTPLALLSSEYTVFTVAAQSPIKRMADLAEQLKNAPDSIAIGMTTRGGTNHVVLCLAAKAMGVDVKQLKAVSFKSNGESITALLGRHIQMVVSTVAASIEQVMSNNARYLAIGSPRRMTGSLASTPTLREQGIDVVKANWRLAAGPKQLSAAEIAYWEDALRRMTRSADWRKALDDEYWADSFTTGAELTKFLESEFAEDKKVLGELGLGK